MGCTKDSIPTLKSMLWWGVVSATILTLLWQSCGWSLNARRKSLSHVLIENGRSSQLFRLFVFERLSKRLLLIQICLHWNYPSIFLPRLPLVDVSFRRRPLTLHFLILKLVLLYRSFFASRHKSSRTWWIIIIICRLERTVSQTRFTLG